VRGRISHLSGKKLQPHFHGERFDQRHSVRMIHQHHFTLLVNFDNKLLIFLAITLLIRDALL